MAHEPPGQLTFESGSDHGDLWDHPRSGSDDAVPLFGTFALWGKFQFDFFDLLYFRILEFPLLDEWFKFMYCLFFRFIL